MRQKFTQNLLFLCLSWFDRYDTPSALDILERDYNDWLQYFRLDHTDIFKPKMTTKALSEIQEDSEWQTILLFRSILEFSGGKVDCRQHHFELDYTASQNASLCARRLSVPFSRQMGSFDRNEMQAALSKSKLFSEVPSSEIQDTLEWSHRLMKLVPVGFPDNYLVRC